MGYHKYEFIGGPFDGERHEVCDGVCLVSMIANPEGATETHLYHREVAGYANGRRVPFFVHKNLNTRKMEPPPYDEIEVI